jgi:hypothetical protein
MQSNSICMPNPDRGVLRLLFAFFSSSSVRLLVPLGSGLTSLQRLYAPTANQHTISQVKVSKGRLTKVIRTTLEIIRGIQTLCEVLGLDRTLRCLRSSLVGPLCLLVDRCLCGRGGFGGAGGTEEPTSKGQYVQQKGKQEGRRTCSRYRVR